MMPLIAASEKGIGQAESLSKESKRCSEAEPKELRRSSLERDTLEGDSPVFEDSMACFKRVVPLRLEA